MQMIALDQYKHRCLHPLLNLEHRKTSGTFAFDLHLFVLNIIIRDFGIISHEYYTVKPCIIV